MAFEYLLLIVATLLFNPGYSLKCSIRINKTSPDVTEKNFLGIWYPQYLITDYDPSTEDIERFACTKYSMEKSNKSNNYEMKLKRFDPRFRDDEELNVFANLLPGITNTFGNFWFDVQKINGKDMWTSNMKILDIFDKGRYMVMLSCSNVRDYKIYTGFVLHREQQMWYKYNAYQYLYANNELDRSLERYFYTLSERPWLRNDFRFVRLTQNVEICQQFDSVLSGAPTFSFQTNFYFILITLFVSPLIMLKF